MTLSATEFTQGIVLDGYYFVKYQQGEPGFEVENISENNTLFLKQLNLAFPSPLKAGSHYSIKHTHHLQTTNLDLEECSTLKEMVLWDIEYFRALLIKIPLANSFALKIISLHITEDQMLLDKIKKRVKELNLRPSI